jgi:hypothetical protein
MAPIALTDAQLDQVMTEAHQVPRALRDMYLQAVAERQRRSTRPQGPPAWRAGGANAKAEQAILHCLHQRIESVRNKLIDHVGHRVRTVTATALAGTSAGRPFDGQPTEKGSAGACVLKEEVEAITGSLGQRSGSSIKR